MALRPLEPDESLRRFIFNERKVDRKKNAPKPAAFMPSPEDWGLSLYRTKGIPESKITKIGRFLGEAMIEGLVAQASIAISAVEREGLKIEKDRIPSLHVNATGWVKGVDPEHKGKQKLVAEKLAKAAVLVPIQ